MGCVFADLKPLFLVFPVFAVQGNIAVKNNGLQFLQRLNSLACKLIEFLDGNELEASIGINQQCAECWHRVDGVSLRYTHNHGQCDKFAQSLYCRQPPDLQ